MDEYQYLQFRPHLLNARNKLTLMLVSTGGYSNQSISDGLTHCSKALLMRRFGNPVYINLAIGNGADGLLKCNPPHYNPLQHHLTKRLSQTLHRKGLNLFSQMSILFLITKLALSHHNQNLDKHTCIMISRDDTNNPQDSHPGSGLQTAGGPIQYSSFQSSMQ